LTNASIAPKRREREFPRFKIELAAIIDGEKVTVCDWSVAGLGLSNTKRALIADEEILVELLIETEGSTLRLPLNTRVVWVKSAEARAGLQIVEPEEKTAPLSDFADLYLAGRIAQDGSQILVLGSQMAEKEKTKAAVANTQVASTGENLTRRILGLVVFLVIGLAAFAFLSNIVYKRLFTFEAVSANIAADTTVVYQPRDGIVEFAKLGDDVKQGERIATITLTPPASSDQATVDVLSPCDCYVVSLDHPGSTYGRAGGRMLTLVGKDAAMFVSIRLPFRRLPALSEKPHISLTYLDGAVTKGVEVISVPKVTEYTVTQLELRVRPGRELAAAMVGQPVLATFDTAPWN
jgi:hypothetical protein